MTTNTKTLIAAALAALALLAPAASAPAAQVLTAQCVGTATWELSIDSFQSSLLVDADDTWYVTYSNIVCPTAWANSALSEAFGVTPIARWGTNSVAYHYYAVHDVTATVNEGLLTNADPVHVAEGQATMAYLTGRVLGADITWHGVSGNYHVVAYEHDTPAGTGHAAAVTWTVEEVWT